MLPSGRQILVTDTVGFISELPKELMSAFRATLEELGGSSLLLHVADASDPLVEDRIESVEKILEATGYVKLPQQIVFNKSDKASIAISQRLTRMYNAPVISAYEKTNLTEVYQLLDSLLDKLYDSDLEQQNIELQLNTA
ncbi:MAG: hypothetical protein AAF462_11550, partial [Thermodesulfobacteriota bacterium]